MYDIEQIKTIYDELTEKVKEDLDEQYNLGRLKGSDYANVYANLMSQCLQLAFQAPLNEQDTIVKQNQAELVLEQKNTQIKQQELLDRQTKGFDDNFRFKLFDSQMNAWAMMFSSGILEDKPSIIANDELSSLYTDIKNSIG